jgi:hypothetical protein
MAGGTNYTGNAAAVESPSPAPSAGAAPIVYLPSDTGDGASWANLFQALKTPLDFITFLQKAALFQPPLTPASGGQGFTAVTHTGSGTGTIAPTAVSSTVSQPTSTPYKFVFKIIAPGAVGTATFQVSLDGGNTYGSTVTTAASYTEPTSGVVVTMSGTFVASDTYAFQATDVNIAAIADLNGIVHGGFDHNGYPRLGRLWKFYAAWTEGTIANATQWMSTLHGAPVTGIGQSNVPSYGGRYAKCNSGTVNATDGSYLSTYSGPSLGLITQPCVASWCAMLSATGANLDFVHGLGAPDPTMASGLNGGCYFLFRTTAIASGPWTGGPDTHWMAVTDNGLGGAGGTCTFVDTGVAPVASAFQNFAVEFYPTGSLPGAPLARFFIGGKLVAVISTNLPTAVGNTAYFGFGACVNGGAAASSYIAVGPVDMLCSYASLTGGV